VDQFLEGSFFNSRNSHEYQFVTSSFPKYVYHCRFRQEFMQVIDPCSGGQLDPVELETAIKAARAPGAMGGSGV
jgi:hypothetical protein